MFALLLRVRGCLIYMQRKMRGFYSWFFGVIVLLFFLCVFVSCRLILLLLVCCPALDWLRVISEYRVG